MKTLLPTIKGKKLQENSTHIAILVKDSFFGDEIQIWLKGLTWVNDDKTVSTYPAEKLWTIPTEEKDDLFAIFERLDEDNRCNMAELNAEYLYNK
jgi:hypothetical protein